MCGKLFCQGGSEYLPWRGRIVTFLTCKAFEPEVIGEEVGMVANGTKCGNKKVSGNCGFYSNALLFCLVWFASQDLLVFHGAQC